MMMKVSISDLLVGGANKTTVSQPAPLVHPLKVKTGSTPERAPALSSVARLVRLGGLYPGVVRALATGTTGSVTAVEHAPHEIGPQGLVALAQGLDPGGERLRLVLRPHHRPRASGSVVRSSAVS